MDRVKKLEAEASERKKDLSALLGEAKKADRALTAEEREQAEKITADIDGIEATLKLERKQLEYDRTEAKPIATAMPAAAADPRPEKFGSVGEQLQAVQRGNDHRLVAAASGLNEGVPSEGGFLLQSDIATDLSSKAFTTGQLASRVRVQEIGPGSNGLKLNLANETSRVSSRYGGIIAYWAAEAALKTDSAPRFRQWDYNLQKLIGLWYATDELLQDVTAMTSVVNEWFADEFGFQLDDAIYNGNGAGKPLGILNAPALVTVTKEAGQAAATIVADNVQKMYSRMPAASLGNAAWFINQETWPQLFKLSQAVGVGGVPMFIPAGGMSQTPAGTLLGRPIVPIEQAAALGTVGDIAFCDFRQYLAIRKGGTQAASSIHVRFVYDESVFRFVLRFNGAPIPNAPLTPYKGSATVSPFVVLATRA
jgi:HK97 family phage major capsid protein